MNGEKDNKIVKFIIKQKIMLFLIQKKYKVRTFRKNVVLDPLYK